MLIITVLSVEISSYLRYNIFFLVKFYNFLTSSTMPRTNGMAALAIGIATRATARPAVAKTVATVSDPAVVVAAAAAFALAVAVPERAIPAPTPVARPAETIIPPQKCFILE